MSRIYYDYNHSAMWFKLTDYKKLLNLSLQIFGFTK
jgi:hypothetical protein